MIKIVIPAKISREIMKISIKLGKIVGNKIPRESRNPVREL